MYTPQAEQSNSTVKVQQLLSSLRKRFDDVHAEVQRRTEEVARYKVLLHLPAAIWAAQADARQVRSEASFKSPSTWHAFRFRFLLVFACRTFS